MAVHERAWANGFSLFCFLGSKSLAPNCDSPMIFSPSCFLALEAVGYRSVQTPTSWLSFSAPQHGQQAEKDALMGIPRQQAIHQLPCRPHDLTGQLHEGIHERLELQSQH